MAGGSDEIPAEGIASSKNVSKEVSFDLNPTIHCFSVDEPTPKHNVQDSSLKTSSFQVFFANITSLSKKACDFLFTLPESVKLLMLTELHKDESHVISKFKHNRYNPSYNPPSQKNEGTHGGEIVATRAHLQAKTIPIEILEYIRAQFGSIHFAAKIVCLSNVDIMFITTYLWTSEGFSERNNTILHTIMLIKQIMKLPIVCIGDFNITYDEFAQSGWRERLKVTLMHPNVSSTLATTANRVIDFGFISDDISQLKINFSAIKVVPWGPHVGIIAEFAMKPKTITQLVQCIPKALPMSVFVTNWNKMDTNEQNLAWVKAKLTAHFKLSKQKQKTGIAILGKPDKVLSLDPKFQNDVLKCQIEQGEILAKAALASEVLVLRVANIPSEEHKFYTGRSQYPKFAIKPVIQDNNYSEYCPHLSYWSKMKQLATHLRTDCSSANPESKDKLIEVFREALFFADQHLALLNDKWSDEAVILHCLSASHDDYTLGRIHDTIKSIHNFVLNKTMNAINTKWTKFVKEQLSLGGSKLFKFISKLDKQFLNVNWDTHGKGASDPTQFLSQQSQTWAKYWDPTNDLIEEEDSTLSNITSEYNEFRQLALSKSSTSQIIFGVSQLDQSLKGYRKETKGSDVWAPSELRSLPEAAKAALASSIQSSLRAVASPHQQLISLNPLLGKPNNSCRTICKTPVLYRMTLRADNSVKEWEIANRQPYDKATIGSSALLAALKRNLVAEIAVWLGRKHATVLNDYEKFFDTLDVRQLMVESIHEEFPTDKLAYALQQHLAPRVLQVNGCSSKPIRVSKSILAGCKFSVAMTRVYLQRNMKELCKNHPQANTELFVDDTTMHASGDTNEDVIQALVPAMTFFQNCVKALKLKLSPKAAIVASNHKLNQRLITNLKSVGLTFTNARHARDLGISHTAGKVRPGNILHTRLKKSKHRISKISKIAKISRKARKLFTGSAFTVATWGHQAAGIAETRIIELERDALACSGIKPAGRCRTFALLVTYGVLGTPRARLVRETMRAWFSIVRQLEVSEHTNLRAAWAKAKATLTDSTNPCSKITGIMSNVIYVLIKAKWVPVAYNVWRDDQNNTWSITNFKVSPDIIAKEVYLSFLQIDLERASKHHNGSGFSEGVDLINTFRYPRALRDNADIDYQYKSALNTVISGGCWPASRINSINDKYPLQCTRCDAELEDDLHTFWTCPCTQNIDHNYIKKSNVYINDAIKEANKYPCLWFRGILPSELTILPNNIVPEEEPVFKYINPITWKSGVYYGDASGGVYSKYQKLIRVGSAVVQVNPEGEVTTAAYTPLPGVVQTVGRGELYALLIMIERLEPLSEVTFVTDNFNVFKTYNKGPKAATLSNNCDLYKTIFRLQYEKALSITVRWMPSHLGKDVSDTRPNGVSHLDVLGNDRADHYAGKAAESVEVAKPIATNYIYYVKLVKAIQRRLAIVICHLPERQDNRNSKPQPVPRIKLKDLIGTTSHVVKQKGNRIFCSKCKCNFAMNDPSCKHWLKTNCEGKAIAAPTTHQPLKIDMSLHRGNNNTHSTHELYSYRGLVYCIKCGARAGANQFRLLSHKCETITSYGKQVLKRIAKGKFPTGITIWPDEVV